MRLFSISMLGILLLVFACKKDKNADPVQQVYDEVLLIHDELMPKMRDINQLIKLWKVQTGILPDSVVQSYISKLEEADEAMMSWMYQFKKPNSAEKSVSLKYLEDQKKKVIQVKDQMLSTIEMAREKLESI